MTPGVYRLTKDLPAIDPDKRVRHGWRCMPMKEGTLFAVRRNISIDDALDLAELYGYSHQMFPLRHSKVQSMLEYLEPVQELTPRQYLALEEYGDYSALRALDLLHAAGKITLEDIKSVLRVVREQSTGDDDA